MQTLLDAYKSVFEGNSSKLNDLYHDLLNDVKIQSQFNIEIDKKNTEIVLKSETLLINSSVLIEYSDKNHSQYQIFSSEEKFFYCFNYEHVIQYLYYLIDEYS